MVRLRLGKFQGEFSHIAFHFCNLQRCGRPIFRFRRGLFLRASQTGPGRLGLGPVSSRLFNGMSGFLSEGFMDPRLSFGLIGFCR